MLRTELAALVSEANFRDCADCPAFNGGCAAANQLLNTSSVNPTKPITRENITLALRAYGVKGPDGFSRNFRSEHCTLDFGEFFKWVSWLTRR